MKYLDILYYIFALIVLAYGVACLVTGSGKTYASIIFIAIGLYFAWRGTVFTRARRQRDRYHGDDPAND